MTPKPPTGPRLVLQPANRPAVRAAGSGALRRFFAIAEAWELSPLQQCKLMKIPSPQVLERYRLGQAPRLSAVQQERIALLASIHQSLGARSGTGGAAAQEKAWAWLNAPQRGTPFGGDSPLYFMLEKGLPALREVARMLVREGAHRQKPRP